MKIIFYFLIPAFILMQGCFTAQSEHDTKSGITVDLIIGNFIDLFPDTIAYKSEAKSYKWNYEQGLILEAFYRMWKLSGEEKYYFYLKKSVDYYVESDGKIKTYKLEDYNLDNIAPGRQLLHLYSATKDAKYKKAADFLIQQLQNQPKTSEGGYWHKQRYPYQMWLDGLYMAEPFYAEYAVMFNRSEYFDEIANQFLLVQKYLKDENTGLYYHGYDESREQKWADPETGRSPNFWGRSVGWFMMALVDVLDYFPNDHHERNTLIGIFTELSENLLKFRDQDKKLWYQIIDQGSREGNYIETSASLMIIYSFAKGVNKQYLSQKYFQIAVESFNSLKENYIITDEQGLLYLQNTVSVGGLGGDPYRDGSFEYYISEPIRINDFKGYGPLMLAAIELNK
ncbi:MAG TPA: glycoside hydrolase family 88 protein [Ignavibacteriaceae bacterium]